MADQEPQQSLHKPFTSPSNIAVVVVPFPAQSHLNQLLLLSHAVSSYNIRVHYVGSALHVSQAKSRATPSQNSNPYLHFHAFPTPEFPSPQPDDPTFPSHLLPCFKASVGLRRPVRNLLVSLAEASARLVVIHDPLMSHVVRDFSSLPNAESYAFYCVAAASRSAFLGGEIPSFRKDMNAEFRSFVDFQFESMRESKRAGILYNSCRVLEGEFLDFILEKERGVDESAKLWAVWPLESTSATRARGHGCLEWLDRQEPNSVLYVCFGTTCHMRDDQIRELALGLEESGAKFIWVLRDADKGNVFDCDGARKPRLPLGFEERVEGVGMVVRDWAPQKEILVHPSTGGFMSHCGWNSCLESIGFGVPIAAWPMHSDQPVNALLVTQRLGAGLVVREWAERGGLVRASVVGDAVRRLMSSEEGDRIRKRAGELGCEMRKCAEKGGVYGLELDSFVAHITRT